MKIFIDTLKKCVFLNIIRVGGLRKSTLHFERDFKKTRHKKKLPTHYGYLIDTMINWSRKPVKTSNKNNCNQENKGVRKRLCSRSGCSKIGRSRCVVLWDEKRSRQNEDYKGREGDSLPSTQDPTTTVSPRDRVYTNSRHCCSRR